MATVTQAAAAVWSTTAGAKTTAAFTPVAGDLLVVISLYSAQDGASTITDGQSGTYNQVGTLPSYSTAQAGTIGIYLRTASVAATSMTVTSTPAGTSTGGGLYVLRVAGAQGYGSAAYRHEGTQADQAAGTPAPVLAAAANPANVLIGAVCTNTNGTANCAPPTGWSEDADVGYNTPPSGLEVCHINSGETNTTITFGGATPSQFGVKVIEIIATQTIAASFIDQSGATFAPTVNIPTAQTVTVGLIDRSGVVSAPTVTQAVTGTFGVTEFGLRIVGTLTETGQYAGAAVTETGQRTFVTTTGGGTVTAPLIDQTGVTFAPSVTQQVQVAFIVQTGATFAPTIGTTVQVPLIDQTGVTFAPTLNQQIQAAFISQVGTTFAPTLLNPQTVTVGLIDQTGVIFTPTISIGGQTVSVPLIGAYGGYEQGYATGGYAIFPPGVSIPAAPVTYPPLIDRTGQTFAPSVAQQVQASFIDQSGATFAPSVNVAGGAQSVSPPLLSYGQVFTPEIRPAQLVNPPLISSTGQTFAPTVSIPSSQSIQVGLISQAGATFAPSVSIPGSQQVTIPLISRAGTLFEPAILPAQLVTPPLLSSIGAVFVPTVASGEMGAPVDHPMAMELATIGAATEQVSEGKATMYVEQGEAI